MNVFWPPDRPFDLLFCDLLTLDSVIIIVPCFVLMVLWFWDFFDFRHFLLWHWELWPDPEIPELELPDPDPDVFVELAFVELLPDVASVELPDPQIVVAESEATVGAQSEVYSVSQPFGQAEHAAPVV